MIRHTLVIRSGEADGVRSIGLRWDCRANSISRLRHKEVHEGKSCCEDKFEPEAGLFEAQLYYGEKKRTIALTIARELISFLLTLKIGKRQCIGRRRQL